jgi:hypothetical protein
MNYGLQAMSEPETSPMRCSSANRLTAVVAVLEKGEIRLFAPVSKPISVG